MKVAATVLARLVARLRLARLANLLISFVSDTLPHFSRRAPRELNLSFYPNAKPLSQTRPQGQMRERNSDPAPQTTTVLWNLQTRQALRLADEVRSGRSHRTLRVTVAGQRRNLTGLSLESNSLIQLCGGAKHV